MKIQWQVLFISNLKDRHAESPASLPERLSRGNVATRWRLFGGCAILTEQDVNAAQTGTNFCERTGEHCDESCCCFAFSVCC